jgi:transposase-like protein
MKNQLVREAEGVARRYSVAFKKKVVQELEKGLLNRVELRAKYGIGGKSSITRWSKEFAILRYKEKALMGRPMKDKLKQRIKELEKQLKDEKFKVLAYETLIEIVKEEDGIDVLKKDGAKRSVSLPKPPTEK